MKVLAFSDNHGQNLDLPEVNPDLVVVLGDMSKYEVNEIARNYACPKVGVPGNHDPANIFENTGIINLHQKKTKINGITFAGFGGCPRYNDKEGFFYEEHEVYPFLDHLGPVDVFIAHANPHWKLNDDMSDPHRGFKSFYQYISEQKPKVFLHGHLHQQKEQIMGFTRVISVYPNCHVLIN